jgi:hypothetical protein
VGIMKGPGIRRSIQLLCGHPPMIEEGDMNEK